METIEKKGTIAGSLKIEGNLKLTNDLIVGEEIEVIGSIDCQGYSIKARGSILAQLHIKCKGVLKAGIYIYAGVVTWKRREEKDQVIECGKLEGGEICFGTLKEIGLKGDKVTIKCEGNKVEISRESAEALKLI